MKNRRTIFSVIYQSIALSCILILHTGCLASQPADAPEKLVVSDNMSNGFEGTYGYEGGKIIIIKNNKTLYFYDSADESYRKLSRVSDTKYTAGPTLLTESPVTVTFQFEVVNGKDISLKITRGKNDVVTARKESGRTKREISFYSGKVKLTGDLYLPQKTGKFPAVVLVHGSGGQDRNGYLNLMALMAENFVNSGIAVLTYDKRGVGASEGDWETAGFDLLASDTIAAVDVLKSRDDIRKDQIGLWGSSQAGWVMAQAVSQRPDIGFVIAVSAAGMGITPGEQNLYYLEHEMKQRNFSSQTISEVLTANKALYDFIKKKISEAEYRNILRKNSSYRAGWWLPPSPESIDWESKSEWFLALDVGFETDQIWKNYKGSILAVFGENDTLTPTARIVSKLKSAEKNVDSGHSGIEVVSKTNHILMTSRNPNASDDFSDSDKFGDGIMKKMVDWVNERSALKPVQK